MKTTRRQLTELALIVSSAAILAACGSSPEAPPPAAQTITFSQPGNTKVGAAPLGLSATATSGLQVSFSSTTPTICTVSGTSLTAIAVGTCTIQANQAGNGAYSAAPVVSRSTTVAPAAVTFSSGFASGVTIEGGGFGGYAGSDLDGWWCNPANPANCGSFGGGSGDTSYFGYYYNAAAAPQGQYIGVFVQAPGVNGPLSTSTDTAGLQLTDETTVKFTFNPNAEWYASSTKNFGVMLTLGKLYLVPGACNIQLFAVVAPTSASGTQYTVNLNDFAVIQNCNVANLTARGALALSPISQVDFQALGGWSARTIGGVSTGANANVASGSIYPTALVLKGAITFQ